MLSAFHIRKIIIDQSKRAHVGHIGSALSVVDIITALYTQILQIPDPDDPDRDRFILSKGHAALALYAALYLKGWITEEQLNTYCSNDSMLGVHPEHQVCGIDFSSGSLGQGLSVSVGAALAARLQNSKRQVYALISDAECNEGSLWEGVMLGAQHQLDNLTVILDLNGQQAFGYTAQVVNIPNMAERWTAFGWEVQTVDGHDVDAIITAMQNRGGGKPHLIIAKTTFGQGVSFMNSQIKWHYLPMTDEQYQQACTELDEANA